MVQENWFFINFVADHLSVEDSVKKLSKVDSKNIMFESPEDIPSWENIIVLSWILSQNYPVGQKSRNWYKILQTGVDYSDYKHNNIVLLMHDDSFGGVGRTKAIYLDKQGNSNIIMYVDLNTIKDENIKYQIRNWYMKWVSTGHNLIESKFEDVEDNGKLLTFDEAMDKYGELEVWYAYFGRSDKLIYTVTKALMIENSVVTIGSNEKAVLTHDTIGNFAIKDAFSEKNIKNLLFNDWAKMQKNELIELIENSVLNKKEQSKFISMLDNLEEWDEKIEEIAEEVEKEINTEENQEETEEGVEKEEVESEEENEEKEWEETEVEDEEGVEIKNDVEESEDKEVEDEEDGEDVEEWEEVEDVDWSEAWFLEDKKELFNSVERHTNDIVSLKNELKNLKDLVDSIEKQNKELIDVVDKLAQLSIKNSQNLSNIVTVGVSEVAVDRKNLSCGLNGLKNLLAKEIK
mgnify:FL=1